MLSIGILCTWEAHIFPCLFYQGYHSYKYSELRPFREIHAFISKSLQGTLTKIVPQCEIVFELHGYFPILFY